MALLLYIQKLSVSNFICVWILEGGEEAFVLSRDQYSLHHLQATPCAMPSSEIGETASLHVNIYVVKMIYIEWSTSLGAWSSQVKLYACDAKTLFLQMPSGLPSYSLVHGHLAKSSRQIKSNFDSLFVGLLQI